MISENRLQQEIFLYHNANFPKERGLLFHVPHENQHRKLNIGVVPGVADLIYLKNGTAIMLEVKTPTGRQSPKQQKWERLVKKNGYAYYIIRSVDDFIAVL